MIYQISISFVMAFLFFVLFFAVFTKGAHSATSRTFNVLILNMALWSLAIAMFYFSETPSSEMFWTNVLYVTGSMIPSSFYQFSFIFPFGSVAISRFKRFMIFVPNIILFGLFFFTPWMVKDIVVIDGVKNFIYGPAGFLFNIQFIVTFFLAYLRLFPLMNTSSGVLTSRLRYIIFASLSGVILAGTTNVIMPALGRFEMVWLGPPLTITWLVGVVYAILKYKIIDMRFIIRRSLIYSFSVTIISVTFLICVMTFERVFQGIVGYENFIGSTIAATIIALMFTPIKNKVQYWIDRLFFKGSQVEIAEQNVRLREEIARAEKYKSLANIASGVAHEIKNPLTAIYTFSEYLPHKLHDEQFLNKFSKIVHKEVHRINDLVHQLLEYGKPAPLCEKQCDVNKLIADTLLMLKSKFYDRNIHLKTIYSHEDLSIQVDPNQIRQALLNVLLNAIDAMPEGGYLWVETNVNRLHFCISIRDSGIGIAQNRLTHIFEPFYTKKDEGTGLGLSITQSIIENHEGRIKVKSAPNAGAEFIIELPLDLDVYKVGI